MEKETAETRLRLGLGARIFFENEAAIEAIATVETRIINAWSATSIDDSEQREKLWFQLHGLKLVMKELHSFVESEKVDQSRIDAAAERARLKIVAFD